MMNYAQTLKALTFLGTPGVELLPTNVIISRGGAVPTEAQIEAAYAAAVEADRVVAIKAKAGEIILARYPAWKQANMTARFVELLNVELAGNLNAVEQATKQTLVDAWAWVKAVRAESDRLEADASATENWPA